MTNDIFSWINFYKDFADKLLPYKNNREALTEGIHEIGRKIEGLSYFNDQFHDGTKGPLKDICPFTVMGSFNRGNHPNFERRRKIAGHLGQFLGVKEAVPDSFDGIPTLDGRASWLFKYEKDRKPDDIPSLWNVFDSALKYVGSNTTEDRKEFAKAFDDSVNRPYVGWRLTFGLYWIRPLDLVTLDENSKTYIEKLLGIPISKKGPSGRCTAEEYLSLLDLLKDRFKDKKCPVHSFPELSLSAVGTKTVSGNGKIVESAALGDTCEKLLLSKKQVVFYGPPGTGKTFEARRVAAAFVLEKPLESITSADVISAVSSGQLEFITFHPSYGYEEFVEGITVDPESASAIGYIKKPGIFKKICTRALQSQVDIESDTWADVYSKYDKDKNTDNENRFVLVIDEINRGDMAKIFGELVTLLEVDKRLGQSDQITVRLPYTNDEFGVPANLYIIGTMNTADVTIALLDIALRRRFAFIEFLPDFEELEAYYGPLYEKILQTHIDAIKELNKRICKQKSLGRDKQIGHSFFFKIRESRADEDLFFVWRYEILPLLEDYCYGDYSNINKLLFDDVDFKDFFDETEGIRLTPRNLNVMVKTIREGVTTVGEAETTS